MLKLVSLQRELTFCPRKRRKNELMDGCRPGAWAICYPSGWVQSDIFVQWFKRFVNFRNASKTNPILLLFDGRTTRTKNIQLIDLARENDILLLGFSSHCIHHFKH